MDLMEDMDLSEPDGLSENRRRKTARLGDRSDHCRSRSCRNRHFRTDRRRRQSICLTKSVRCGSQKESIKEVYNSSGTIESENTKTYYSPVTAPIANLNAKVGQIVQAGDLLVTFDTTNLERDNQQAQLNLQSAYNTSSGCPG